MLDAAQAAPHVEQAEEPLPPRWARASLIRQPRGDLT